jgi:hypothetical protein
MHPIREAVPGDRVSGILPQNKPSIADIAIECVRWYRVQEGDVSSREGPAGGGKERRSNIQEERKLMSLARRVAVLLGVALCVAASAWAQMGRGMGPHLPMMPGKFNPEIGSGAEYKMQAKDQTIDFTYAVVGKESVDGATGYWMEIRMKGGQMPGETVMKQLMVAEGDKFGVKKMIMQAPGRPPMEMPGMMMSRMQAGQASAGGGAGEKPQDLGTETITVPAGTFVCQHMRSTGKETMDFWIATNVRPYGVVKMAGKDMNMVLEKVLTGETSHIKGTPQKMEMPHF